MEMLVSPFVKSNPYGSPTTSALNGSGAVQNVNGSTLMNTIRLQA